MTGEAALEREESLHLTTIGRKTGQRRRVELWFAYRDGACYLLAGAHSHGRGSHWYRNGLANPRIEVEAGRTKWEGTFEALDEGEVKGILPLFHAKYGEETVKRWYTDARRLPARLILQK